MKPEVNLCWFRRDLRLVQATQHLLISGYVIHFSDAENLIKTCNKKQSGDR